MEPSLAAEVEIKYQKTDEAKGNSKSYDCGLYDTEVVYKIAQELLPVLASACVDNTTGGIFKNVGSIAADMRKEMVDYLTQRSESYVAEFLLAENASGVEVYEHPYDIIISLIDDFAASKRNISEEEVVEHRSECKFRPMDCTNEGCTTRYCAAQKEHHEAVCSFMILPCVQKCSDFVMTREMDRHCVTICPMKLVNCVFYTVGCQSIIPRCNVQQHNAGDLSSHLLYIIRVAHKEATEENLKHKVEQILNLSNAEKLARARDARALTYLIKDVEAKLGPLEVETKPETNISKGEKAAAAESPPSNKKESPTTTDPLHRDEPDSDSPPNKKEERLAESPIKMEESKESYSSTVEEEGEKRKEDNKEKDAIKQEPSHNDQELETTRGEKEPKKKESSKQSFISDEQEESKKTPKQEESSKQSFSSDE
ncbi:hypothetical protein L6452_22311 [Arctium lappa]|uniref:Uncharacterized protein n=1 Tax=Arctium lappa TaxID=4217 RepID=A0ACB9AZQ5_ARCLA|nr:hypothetical protein L6452_22311 [Arctium lappa]